MSAMSLESRVFEQELPTLTSLLSKIDYNQFGNSLVSNEVISQATMAAVLSTIGASRPNQVERLSKAMLDQVKQNAKCFDCLILLMKSEPQLDQFADQILKTYWGKGGWRLLEWNTSDSTNQYPEPSQPVRSKSSQPLVRSEAPRLVPSQPSVRSEAPRLVPFQPVVRPQVQPEPLCSLETSVLMNELAASIPAKWRAVGAQLNVPSGILDGIQVQGAGHPQGSLHCFSHMLEEWKSRRTSPYTWENLLFVLRSNVVGEVALADRLARTHGVLSNQTAPQPSVATISKSSSAAAMGYIDDVPTIGELGSFTVDGMSRIDDVPTIGELGSFTVDGDKITIMADVAERWRDLCVTFNFDPVQRTAQKIKHKWNGDPTKCCLEMFQLWLKTKDASWRSLIRVLNDCKESLLVSQIKTYIGAAE